MIEVLVVPTVKGCDSNKQRQHDGGCWFVVDTDRNAITCLWNFFVAWCVENKECPNYFKNSPTLLDSYSGTQLPLNSLRDFMVLSCDICIIKDIFGTAIYFDQKFVTLSDFVSDPVDSSKEKQQTLLCSLVWR